MLLSDLIKQLEATKTIQGDITLSDTLTERIIEMIAVENPSRDQKVRPDLIGGDIGGPPVPPGRHQSIEERRMLFDLSDPHSDVQDPDVGN